VHVTGDYRDQVGTGRDPRGDGGATCKIAGIAYTGSNPVPATLPLSCGAAATAPLGYVCRASGFPLTSLRRTQRRHRPTFPLVAVPILGRSSCWRSGGAGGGGPDGRAHRMISAATVTLLKEQVLWIRSTDRHTCEPSSLVQHRCSPGTRPREVVGRRADAERRSAGRHCCTSTGTRPRPPPTGSARPTCRCSVLT
jgi:hypothetical protein